MVTVEKSNLVIKNVSNLQEGLCLKPAEPLWKRVPTKDKDGKHYSDFMMLIPGLKQFDAEKLQKIIAKVEQVLKSYEKYIVLADLNLKLNVLWVTIKPRPGLSSEIAALLHHLIPEAKLVAQKM